MIQTVQTLRFPDPSVPPGVRLLMLATLVSEKYHEEVGAPAPERFPVAECGQLCWSPDRGPMR